MAQITTVIPTYRRPKLLRRAILSVLRQTYTDLEVHVYDNASGDQTEQVVADLACVDSRVKYHCQNENVGLLRNCIYGIEQAQTPYLHLLSDDDLIFPHFYELAVNTLNRRPEVMLFAGATIRVYLSRHTTEIPLLRWTRTFYPAPEGLFEILHRGHPDWTGILFRRSPEILSSLDLTMGNFLDVDLTCRYAALYPIEISKISCALLTQHESSASAIAEGAEPYGLSPFWPNWLQLADRISRLSSIKEEDRNRARRLILRQSVRHIFLRACRAAAVGDVRAAENAANVLANHFGSHLRARVIDIFARVSRPPVSFVLTPTVDALRRLRARRRETILPADEWQRCAALLAQIDEK